jgi:protein-tyrosine-phosphatase
MGRVVRLRAGLAAVRLPGRSSGGLATAAIAAPELGYTVPDNTVGHVFEVVFVCTGNRARSPLAEALFRRYTTDLDVTVSSLGTMDTVGGLPPLPHALEVGRNLGVDLRQHRARILRKADLSSADLVVGFEQSHVSAGIEIAGALPDRTYLLRELVALLGTPVEEEDPVLRACAAVANANARRLPSRWTPGLGIADPLGKPVAVMTATALEIDGLVRRLVDGLFGVRADAAT